LHDVVDGNHGGLVLEVEIVLDTSQCVHSYTFVRVFSMREESLDEIIDGSLSIDLAIQFGRAVFRKLYERIESALFRENISYVALIYHQNHIMLTSCSFSS
jgi:hypothetical protein